MTDKVKCSVDNCNYWENQLCQADSIEVGKNFLANNDMEAGMLGKDSHDSAQTKCITFIKKK